jgi:replicative DNA helicase
MPSLIDESILESRKIEQIFAALVSNFPVFAVVKCGWLSADTIFDGRIRALWQAIIGGVAANTTDERADAIVSQAAAELGLIFDLTQWRRELPYGLSPDGVANEISRRHYLTAIGSRLSKLAVAVQSRDDIQVRNLIAECHDAHIRMSDDDPPTLEEISEKFNTLVDTGGRSIKTHIPSIDHAFGGLERMTLTALAGRPGMGKSALGMQIAQSVARVYGETNPVQFFSLEMDTIGLWARLACPRVETTWRDVLDLRINAEQRAKLKDASIAVASELSGKLVIRDTPATTENVWRVASTTKPSLIVIDHLRLLKDSHGENETLRVGWISERLHDMAKAIDAPILLLVQLNRDVERRDVKVPVLADLRGSGEIEENIDNCWMMYRPDYYTPTDQPGSVQLWGRKFRNGASDIKASLFYDRRSQWFTDAKERVVNLRDMN